MHALLQKFAAIPLLHLSCRSTHENKLYYNFGKSQEKIERPVIPQDKLSWSVKWDDYKNICVKYTSSKVLAGPVWADPDSPKEITKWNDIDGNIDRRTFHGTYEIDPNGLPLNPVGRTGVCGRGLLGRWGPNHAVDPLVTRWKRDENGSRVKHDESGAFILQVVLIQRCDSKQWALPGGMCEPGETVSETLRREFTEEALNVEKLDRQQRENINRFFHIEGVEVYRGYVDDPRNTDNAWIETVCQHFHDEDGSVFNGIQLKYGSDAINAKWADVDKSLHLYANHIEFVKRAAKRLKAHW